MTDSIKNKIHKNAVRRMKLDLFIDSSQFQNISDKQKKRILDIYGNLCILHKMYKMILKGEDLCG